MTGREDNERRSENQNSEVQDSEDNDAASRTEEQCRKDASAFNGRMDGEGAAAADQDYFDDTSFDAQLDRLDWESGEDPFETLPEMEIILHNLEP